MNFVLECCERQVIEEEFQEKDSRSGKETKHVSRGVGEKVSFWSLSQSGKWDLCAK
jgi:hypothetical protein